MPLPDQKEKLLTLLTETDRLLQDQIGRQMNISSEQDTEQFFEQSIPLLWEHRIHMKNMIREYE